MSKELIYNIMKDSINRNRLYLDNVEKVNIKFKNQFYNYVIKYGKLPIILENGYVIFGVLNNENNG